MDWRKLGREGKQQEDRLSWSGILDEAENEPSNSLERGGVYQFTRPIINDRLKYDATFTIDIQEDSLFIGAELHPGIAINEKLHVDLWNENGQLNHSKLTIEPNEGEETFRVGVVSEIRIPYLNEDSFVREVQAFDEVFKYEYDQVRGLAGKYGIEVPEISSSDSSSIPPKNGPANKPRPLEGYSPGPEI